MSDLFLGAKRASRGRRIARRVVLGLAGGFVAVLVGYVGFLRATRYPIPGGAGSESPLGVDGERLTLDASSLERQGELWVLRAAGDPFDLGFASARLLGATAVSSDGVLDASVVGEGSFTGLSGSFADAQLRWRYRQLAEGLPDGRRAELAGLAAGLRRDGLRDTPDYQTLVWRQAALDVGSTPGADLPGVAGGLAFALGGPPVNKVVVGRVFGLPGAAPPGPVVVSFVKPAGAIPFARVGWAGEVGALTGVNGEGLVVIVNPALTQDVRADGVGEPVAMIGRDLLEKAHSLDEAIALIQAAHPLGAATFLIVDGKTSNWAVVARSPGKTVIAKPKPGALPVIGDFLAGPEFAKDADNDRARRSRRGAARFDRLSELLAKPVPPEALAAAALLRDRRGKGDAHLPLGNGNAIDDLDEAHVVIIDTGAMVMYVGEGPGAAGALRPFDLRHELAGEPLPVPPPAVVPADATVDLGAARNIVAARHELRAAARAARAGHLAAAEDGVTRALALAPHLSDAYKLAGDLAREAGDGERAAAHYRRYLELIPADPAREQEVRAYLGGP